MVHASLTKLRIGGAMRGTKTEAWSLTAILHALNLYPWGPDRAFGYKKLGKQPFKDVAGGEWYANEINIYNQGYFQGSSKTTASPNDSLTREEAAVLAGLSDADTR